MEEHQHLLTINPATEEPIKEYPVMSSGDVESAILSTDKAQQKWATYSYERRAEALQNAAEILRNRKEEWAELMAREMGKPVTAGEAEAEKCAWVCDYYADNGGGFLADDPVEMEAEKSYVTYQPLGVLLAVMPWNYPFWQVFRFGAGALMAGNGFLIKHAPNTTGCGLALESIFKEAGFPEDLVRTLVVNVSQVEGVIHDERIKAVTVTGSTRAGKAVAAQAGSALKKCVLELGGSDPFLVMEDANLEKAIKVAAKARMLNSGQSCIAAKRFLVADGLYDDFVEGLVDHFRTLTMGDPLKRETDVGPQARHDLRKNLHRQVAESIARGAKDVMGATIPDQPGYYYPPTILTDVEEGMPVFDEEVFGPVASVIRFKDEEEAITLANNTEYGLGAAVFSEDLERAEKLGREHLNCGCSFINDFVKSDPRMPFGGIKASGYGCELGKIGIKEFTNPKSVAVTKS